MCIDKGAVTLLPGHIKAEDMLKLSAVGDNPPIAVDEHDSDDGSEGSGDVMDDTVHKPVIFKKPVTDPDRKRFIYGDTDDEDEGVDYVFASEPDNTASDVRHGKKLFAMCEKVPGLFGSSSMLSVPSAHKISIPVEDMSGVSGCPPPTSRRGRGRPRGSIRGHAFGNAPRGRPVVSAPTPIVPPGHTVLPAAIYDKKTHVGPTPKMCDKLSEVLTKASDQYEEFADKFDNMDPREARRELDEMKKKVFAVRIMTPKELDDAVRTAKQIEEENTTPFIPPSFIMDPVTGQYMLDPVQAMRVIPPRPPSPIGDGRGDFDVAIETTCKHRVPHETDVAKDKFAADEQIEVHSIPHINERTGFPMDDAESIARRTWNSKDNQFAIHSIYDTAKPLRLADTRRIYSGANPQMDWEHAWAKWHRDCDDQRRRGSIFVPKAPSSTPPVPHKKAGRKRKDTSIDLDMLFGLKTTAQRKEEERLAKEKKAHALLGEAMDLVDSVLDQN